MTCDFCTDGSRLLFGRVRSSHAAHAVYIDDFVLSLHIRQAPTGFLHRQFITNKSSL